MTNTLAGIPGGYGYFEKTASPGVNIMEEVRQAITENDKSALPVAIQTMTIQVDGECKVKINNRLPVLVQPDIGLSFDVRGTVFSLEFDTAVSYNLAFSY